MKLKGIPIKGYDIDKKTGKPKRVKRRQSVSNRIAERNSTKVRVGKQGVQ